MTDLLPLSCALDPNQIVVLQTPPGGTTVPPPGAGAGCGPNVSPFALAPGHMAAGDKLRMRAWSGLHNASALVTLRTTLLMPDCTIAEVGQTLNPNSLVDPAEKLMTMPESVIRTAAFTVASSDSGLPWVGPGLVYVRLDVLKADTPDNFSRGQLIAGYVSSINSPSYPTSPPQLPGEGPGHMWQYASDPFSGEDSGNFDPGPRRIIRPVWISYGMTTDATAGNRYPSVFFANQAGGIAHAIAPVALGPTGVGEYLFQPQSATGGPAGARIQVPVPAVPPFGQYPQVVVNVSNGCQAGDVIAGYVVTYEEWIDPEWEFE